MPPFRRSALKQSVTLVAVAAGFFLAVRQWGISNDCAPQQVDGQCGMSSAYAEVIGAVGAFIILAIFGVLIGIAHDKRQQDQWERKQEP